VLATISGTVLSELVKLVLKSKPIESDNLAFLES
jgi:hypothetical protein